MFSKACSIARQFTCPIIISHRTYKGDCFAALGSFVIINPDGWFVTAFHIVNHIMTMEKQQAEYMQMVNDRKVVEADPNIYDHVKSKKLHNQLKILPNAITNYSIVWANSSHYRCAEMHMVPEIDLAFGRFENFDTRDIKVFPTFKDPNKPMEQGTSLCKMGFPFHEIKPTFDGHNFNLPNGSLPAPIFPIEGIYTREVYMGEKDQLPLFYLETSSPGLMGQSGGPTIDINGSIWAIQSQTKHFALGFRSEKNTKEAEHLSNQYLNVGWGIHAKTLIGAFKQKNVSYGLSDY